MKCKPGKITFRVKQQRYVDVEISEDRAFDMPETVQECIDISNEIKKSPLIYINQYDWQVEQNEIIDIKFHE